MRYLFVLIVLLANSQAIAQTPDLDTFRSLPYKIDKVGDSTNVGYGVRWIGRTMPQDTVWSFVFFADSTEVFQAVLDDTTSGVRRAYVCAYSNAPCSEMPWQVTLLPDSVWNGQAWINFYMDLDAFQSTEQYKKALDLR